MSDKNHFTKYRADLAVQKILTNPNTINFLKGVRDKRLFTLQDKTVPESSP